MECPLPGRPTIEARLFRIAAGILSSSTSHACSQPTPVLITLHTLYSRSISYSDARAKRSSRDSSPRTKRLSKDTSPSTIAEQKPTSLIRPKGQSDSEGEEGATGKKVCYYGKSNTIVLCLKSIGVLCCRALVAGRAEIGLLARYPQKPPLRLRLVSRAQQ